MKLIFKRENDTQLTLEQHGMGGLGGVRSAHPLRSQKSEYNLQSALPICGSTPVDLTNRDRVVL